MVSKVTIDERAQIEIQDALDYYKEISTELSDDLIVKFRQAAAEIVSHPKWYPCIRGKYRKINVERFPYKIVFRLTENDLHIVAFSHHKQRPDYWRKR